MLPVNRRSRPDMWLGLVFMTLVTKVTSIAPKAFFNQSSVAYLSTSWSLRQPTTFSFRTCSGNGEMLYQPGNSGQFLELRLTNGSMEFKNRAGISGTASSILIGENLVDNRWYNVEMNFIIGVCELKILRTRTVLFAKVLANSTFNQQLLALNFSGGRNLVVGRTFEGCLNEGRSVSFNSTVQSSDVLWNQCPLEQQTDCTTVDTNDCWNDPCDNGGKCIDGIQSFQCECPVLYNGTLCQNYIGNLGCVIKPCQNEATCSPSTPVSGNLPFTCKCVPGYTGTLCETDMDECESTPNACLNSGRCVDGINSYSCNCSDTGYEGPNCSTNIDECQTFDCGMGAPCRDSPGSFTCDCPDGYTDTPCRRVNACDAKPCKNQGVCRNEDNGYTCSCSLGYTGRDCDTVIDHCINVTCPGEHVICQNGLASYTCRCEPGYIGSPGNCTEFDECTTTPCQNGGTCTNFVNAFLCECPRGFNGTNCELTNNNCASRPCVNGGSCTDGQGDFSCECVVGYTGKDCSTNINDCAVVPYPCVNGGLCQDQINGNTCDCPPGYTGFSCETDIDECEDTPCLNQGTCHNGNNSYTCDCAPGFTDVNCSVNIDDCTPNPCQNNGACNDGVMSYTCNCTDQWMGKNCTILYDACSFKPCRNNGTCSSQLGSRDYSCSCVTGYTGTDCETNIDDCVGVNCGPFQICWDGLDDYTCDCPKGYSGVNCSVNIDECSTFPCRNNASCHDGLGTYTCDCQVETVNLTRYMSPGTTHVFQTGFTGRNCEIDINECDNAPNVCLHDGSCRNKVGGYTCYCGNEQLPGSPERVYYTGTNCEITTNYCQVADEARFDPPVCKNNGTCKGGNGKFECECVPGFNGTRCEHNIDDCAKVRQAEGREPCFNNGTCHDGINAYRCECIPGITGHNCTVNIDDCKSGPCDNGGRCTDAINELENHCSCSLTGYTCNCQDTGFTGENCTENIDDCRADLCQNGAECVDDIKDYNCSCFLGYSGKNCEVDIDECSTTMACQNGGSCYERSQDRYYPNNPIPGNFSYATASGYFCICRDGFNGSSCENDIDECLLSPEPCLNGGSCRDAVNSYTCACATGFHGDRCESEVNECLVYQPCRNGATCSDRVADYNCECLPSLNRTVYGGKNCSTELTGCVGNRCQNDAVCVPILENEMEGHHNYSCDCRPGWTGDYCSVDTSVSFFGNSYIDQPISPSNVSQRIRTTVPNGVVTLIGSTRQNFISLELKDGKPCILVRTGFPSQPACLPVVVSDGVWHEVTVELLPSSVSLSLLGDQQCDTRQCQISMFRGSTQEGVVFGGVRTVGDILNQTLTRTNYIGCVQDMKIDNSLLRSSEIPANQKHSIDIGCRRVEQCSMSSCQSRGTCVDKWFSSECGCDRPYYGSTCGEEIQPVTFSPGNNVSSVQFIADPQNVNVSLHELNLSFFFTTRKNDGVLFFMGGRLTAPDAACNQYCNYFLLQLEAGMVCLKYRVCNSGDQIRCSPAGMMYSDGDNHFLEVHRKETELSLLIDGLRIFETRLLDVGVLCEVHSDNLFFGSLPNVATQRKKREAGNPSIYNDATNFKGVIQDVRLNDNLMAFYPLATADQSLPPPFPAPRGIDSVVQGIVNDDVCTTTTPCQNNATCTNTDYNDYNCSCGEGFAGKDCDFVDFCRQSPCPENSTCYNLQGGYECVIPATFNQGSSGVQYQGAVGIGNDLNSISLKLRTRELTGIMVSLRNRFQTSEFFMVEVVDGAVQVSYSLDTEGVKNVKSDVTVSDGVWHSVEVEHYPSNLRVSVDGTAVVADTNTVKTLADLIKGTVLNQINSTDLLVGNDLVLSQSFVGCLDDVRLAGILLPFYSDAVLQIPSVNNATKRFSLSTPQGVEVGCRSQPVCGVASPVCQNGASCTDLWNKFECNCTEGWEGETCADNIDDCVNNDCQNGATCRDQLNAYTCDCVPGFYGWRCEAETNECQNLPCNNSGICTDLINDFECNCTANYTGKVCDILITETCDRKPCMNGATCHDYNVTIDGQEVARFNCSCAPGYEGRVCAEEINYCAGNPCIYGRCVSNVTLLDYTCFCHPGYTDKNCSTEINECDPIPCKNGATCNDFVNGYNCSCSPGWEDDHCDVDIPECNRTENACGPWGTCIERQGSYDCDCDPGFRANRSIDCETTDRCQVVVLCEDIDECAEGYCKNGASCNNSIGDYVCNCTLGYDGKNCDIGNCSYDQCLQGSTCLIDPFTNRWRCECLPFYDGDQCDIIGPCVAEPCQNGATCKQNVTDMTYICECPPGFNGDNCTDDIDECLEDNPCQNNATCNNTYGSYNCSCLPGFAGRDCETNINDCANIPCKNGGVCIDLVNEFMCNCSDTGFEGNTCEVDIDECETSAPCQHSSTCINEPGSFSCKCPDTHEGVFCETARATGEEDSDKIGIIVGVVVGFIVLVAIICLIVLIVLARNKRATRGTYSPSRQEMSGSRVELGHVIKPPPEERLI